MSGDYIAQAFRDGDIAINRENLPGAIPVGHGERDALLDALRSLARFGYSHADQEEYGYEGYLMLVPGIPEAEDYTEAQEALSLFSRAVRRHMETRPAVNGELK